MGGQNSEVKEDTTDLVLEVACFNPRTIRWVSKTLGLSSDSSYRFERGIDIHSLEYARDRAIQLILETAGGELCEPSFSAGIAVPSDRIIAISTDWVRAVQVLRFPMPRSKTTFKLWIENRRQI